MKISAFKKLYFINSNKVIKFANQKMIEIQYIEEETIKESKTNIFS